MNKTRELSLEVEEELRATHHEVLVDSGKRDEAAWGSGAARQRGPASRPGWKEEHILPSGEGGRTLQAERTAGAKRECERAWCVWGR